MAATLADYRGRHAGETIVVCGCGPSLLDWPDAERGTTIGVNDVGRRFDPTYLVVVNPAPQFAAGRFEHVRRSRAKALFTQLDLGAVAPPVVRFALGRRGATDASDGRVLHYTRNSPYVAVGLAEWMGAARIGLIGVDLVDGHFFGATGAHPLAARWREVDAEYARLAAALRARGVELVNLSARSRLVSLPRAFGIGAPPPAARSSTRSLTVAVDHAGGGAVGQFLAAAADGLAALGHRVVRSRSGIAAGASPMLAVVWNGRQLRTPTPVLYAEHGWLPRSDYQLSPNGINADSHAALHQWDGKPLATADDAALELRLAALRGAAPHGGVDVASGLPARFLLVALQIESDTNILRHAPPGLRTMQALADRVARLDPPWPVVFKQHPADARRANRQLTLRLRRPQDRLWRHDQSGVHAMLASGRCAGVLTINSNVAHDALLWDVPAIVLGRNVWPQTGVATPFLTAAPADWSRLAAHRDDAEARACRRAYAWHLIGHQWTLADVRDPAKLGPLVERALSRGTRAAVVPAPAPMPAAQLPAARRLHGATPPPLRIEVVAEPRGWLFAHWQRQLAATGRPGIALQACARPSAAADAWIFVRAREAARCPDPSRAVVQLHDLFDAGRYRPGGERAIVARCGALSLTHPAQQALLAGSGISLQDRRWLLCPVGHASAAPRLRRAATSLPVVAWVGRPALHDGREASGLDRFVAAARELRGRAQVLLLGERLAAAADALRKAGVAVQAPSAAACPVAAIGHWVARADLLVVTGTADSGPWPIFDALQLEVPVLAEAVGWAPALLVDGRGGRLLDGREPLAAAIVAMLASERPASGAPKVADYTLAAWARSNVELAAALTGAATGWAAAA